MLGIHLSENENENENEHQEPYSVARLHIMPIIASAMIALAFTVIIPSSNAYIVKPPYQSSDA